MRAENCKGATDVFARLMAISPDSAEAHVMMGMAHRKLGQTKAAAEAIQARQSSNYGRKLGAEGPGHQ